MRWPRSSSAKATKQVFYFPASPIAEAIARAGIRLILTRQERVAGNMADGISRSTNGRQMGVFAVQELAGSENAFPGVSTRTRTRRRRSTCRAPALHEFASIRRS